MLNNKNEVIKKAIFKISHNFQLKAIEDPMNIHKVSVYFQQDYEDNLYLKEKNKELLNVPYKPSLIDFDTDFINYEENDDLESQIKDKLLNALESIGLCQCQLCSKLFNKAQLKNVIIIGLLCEDCVESVRSRGGTLILTK